MADVPLPQSGAITATNNYVLGSAPRPGVGTLVVHIVGTFVANLVVKARKKGTSASFVAIPFVKRYFNGAVADDSVVSTTITGISIIKVDASGLDISLDVTYTSGTITVYSEPLVGSAA